jgi:hypothetical protein
VHLDELDLERTAFDRYFTHQRLNYQMEALLLAQERMQLMARFQEARLGLHQRTKLQWVMHVMGITARGACRGIDYVIRRALP